MKKIIKLTTSLLVAIVLITLQFNDVFAIGLSKNASTVSPGGSFTISVGGLSNVRGQFSVLVNNGSGNTSFFANGADSFSTTITAGASGTVTVSVSAVDAFTLSEEPVSWSSSVSVNVTPPSNGGNAGQSTNPNNKPSIPQTPETPVEDTRSKDNSLSGLTVSAGTLTPEFNKDVMDYSVNVDSKITKLTIGATATDAKATVSGAGEKDVVPGENSFEIVVTAENKSTKKYVIKVIVDETPTVFIEHGKAKLGVVKNLRDVTAPVGFEETTVNINGEDVKAWTNGNMNKTIVYMVNENNEKNFYLYDKGVTSIFKPLALLGRNVYIVDVASDKQKVEGLKYQEVTIDGNVLMGWTFKDKAFANYSVVSVMNEKGELVNYQYESTENTMQLYDGGAPITQKEYDSAKKYETYTMIAGGVALVAVATMIVSLALCIKYKKANIKIIELVSKGNKVEKGEK